MIQAARNRILVKVIGRYDDLKNPLGLNLVDQQKHWQGTARRGEIISVGPGVTDVSPGEIVVYRADAGFSLDGDPELQNEVFGEAHRWLKIEDCMAVEEPREVLA